MYLIDTSKPISNKEENVFFSYVKQEYIFESRFPRLRGREKERYVSSLRRSSSKSSTVLENQCRCTVFSSTVSRAMISSARTPSFKFVQFFVEEFHRAQKPAPLHRFLVHGQSGDDKQRPSAKSQVCAVLRRKGPPCAETSTTAPFSRPRNQRRCTVFSSTVSRAMISSAHTPSLKSMPFFVEEFHRARKSAPLHRFLVHGQLSDDKQRPYAKSQVYAVLR
ncbi:hypothetical protein EVAR_102979_1 [Eumeta japonica]|uniref:Uncharacterized protein n=1 Tax=Eumeta variegata TaxID=151549 RepID=A0A4C1UR00_EUMVA|nr:hypothetical protein EVAR_102979_1 [Eumeta japonica]